MTQGDGRGISGVGGLRQCRESQALLDHALDLRLVGTAPTGNRVLHLGRRVLGHDTTRVGRKGENNPAGLPHRHGGAHVVLEEHLLHGDRAGAELGDQVGHLALQHGKALGEGRVHRGADDSQRERLHAPGHRDVEHGIPAPGQTGVHTQDD